jgi:nicotinamidase-related amidase
VSADRPRRRDSRDRGNGGSAVVVVDLLNPYEHEDAEQLAESVAEAIPGVRRLLERAADAGVPVIYVNDNYGDWDSSSEKLRRRALEGRRPELVEPVLPPEGSSFVIKARHSIFYGTPLEYVLDQMEVSRLVLSGQATEQCILYSALDAYVRHFEVAVPPDAVAHIHRHLAEAALEMMERNMSADLARSADCTL